jgi:putative phage-type endonuclease
MTGRTAGHGIELLLPGAEADDRERWLETRARGVTASEIGVIMGLSSYQSAFSLYWEKKGMIPPEPDNPRMALGRYLEGFVCDQFAERYPDYELIRLGLTCSSERMWQMATCDRIAVPRGSDYGSMIAMYPVPVEAKTSGTFDGWGPEGSDQVPLAYRCQVLWQMDVLGADHGYVVCLFLLTQEIRVYEIARDDDDIAVLRHAAQEFLHRLDTGDHPPIDGSAATRRALQHLYPLDDEMPAVQIPRMLVRRYESAVRNYREAQERKNIADNLMREALGEAKQGVDVRSGEKIVSRSVYNVNGHYRKATTVDRLTPSRKGKDG